MTGHTASDSLPHTIVVDNQYATAKVSLFGGQIVSFIPKHDMRERLWLSPQAVFDKQTPIRGGIPICWPWFGKHPTSQAPNHGYVRNQLWQIVEQSESKLGTQIILAPHDASMKSLGFDATLKVSITVGRRLTVCLTMQNVSNLTTYFNGALHSYFAVSDITKITINGVSGKYIDQLAQNELKTTPSAYVFSQEVDRIHLTQDQTVVIQDVHPVQIQSTGHDSLVIWNPWIEKTKTLKDMPQDGYKTMVCVETAITQGIALEEGQSHQLMQTVD